MKTAQTFLVVLFLLVLASGSALASEPWCQGAPGVCVSNVTSTAMTLSWTTVGHGETGSVQWGASPDALNKTARDDRGDTASGESHQVTLTGLSPEAAVYFTVTSGGTSYTNDGRPWTALTGAGLSLKMPSFMVVHVFQADGVTPARGATVFLKSTSGGPQSATLSKVVSDAAGMVMFDLNSLRSADSGAYYAWESGDLAIYTDGASMGTDSYEGSVPAFTPPGSPTLTIVIGSCTGCTIAGTCYPDGAANPAKACQTCNAAHSRTVWSVAPATAVCRAAANLCDVPEYCTGESTVCPENQFASSTTVCGAGGADYCSGTSATCEHGTTDPDGGKVRILARLSRFFNTVSQIVKAVTSPLRHVPAEHPMAVAANAAAVPATAQESARPRANNAAFTASDKGTYIAPVCPETVGGDARVEIPVVADKLDGQSQIGFGLAFDPTVLTYKGYTLQGGVLEGWAETFTCELNEIESRVECEGASNDGLPRAEMARLVTILFTPKADAEGAVLKTTDALAVKTVDKNRTGTLAGLMNWFGAKLGAGAAPAVFAVQGLAGDVSALQGYGCQSDVVPMTHRAALEKDQNDTLTGAAGDDVDENVGEDANDATAAGGDAGGNSAGCGA